MLLLQRPTGTWEPPAGRLAPGESFEGGAVREVYEETGLLVAPQRLLATWVGPRSGGGLLASATYVSRVAAAGVRLSNEHLRYRWVTLGEWLELPRWWSRENVLSVAGPVGFLPAEPFPEPPPPVPPRPGTVSANLGAGTVIVDLRRGDEPRALLLRRRKPPEGLWENPGGMLEPGVRPLRRPAWIPTPSLSGGPGSSPGVPPTTPSSTPASALSPGIRAAMSASKTPPTITTVGSTKPSGVRSVPGIQAKSR